MKPVSDIIAPNLKILFIGFNPGSRSAQTGHHFAGYSNKFWKLLAASGLTPYQFTPEEDCKLLDLGLGITNIVARPSRTAAEITKAEFQAGRLLLQEKLAFHKPLVACYAGVGVYREFARQAKVVCGWQTENVVTGVADFVVPSPSGLTRILFVDQLAYYQELKENVSE
ncbi:MAG: mug [Firmicutes bacterium]|nr:mug [Bacillota bacterium]